MKSKSFESERVRRLVFTKRHFDQKLSNFYHRVISHFFKYVASRAQLKLELDALLESLFLKEQFILQKSGE